MSAQSLIKEKEATENNYCNELSIAVYKEHFELDAHFENFGFFGFELTIFKFRIGVGYDNDNDGLDIVIEAFNKQHFFNLFHKVS